MTFYLTDGAGNILTDDLGNRLTFLQIQFPYAFTITHGQARGHTKMIGY
jgi:hypothetical protein